MMIGLGKDFIKKERPVISTKESLKEIKKFEWYNIKTRD